MEHGTVTNVRYQDGVPICSVQLQGRVDNEDKAVPVMRGHHGMFLVPEENQKVQILNLEDQRFIVGVLDKNDSGENPSMSEGEMAFQLDANTYVRFTKNGSGGYDVGIKASGEVNIDADGNVFIDGIDFDQHVHEHEDDTINDTGDGSGSSSTATKTTEPPQ